MQHALLLMVMFKTTEKIINGFGTSFIFMELIKMKC